MIKKEETAENHVSLEKWRENPNTIVMWEKGESFKLWDHLGAYDIVTKTSKSKSNYFKHSNFNTKIKLNFDSIIN